MKIDIHKSDALLLEHGKALEEVLRKAGRQALREHMQAGHKVATWQDDKIVLVNPAEILEANPED